VGSLKRANVGENSVGNLLCAEVADGTEEPLETILPVHLFLDVFGVEDSVGDEDDHVTRLCGNGELLIGDVGKEAEREALSLDEDGFAGATEELSLIHISPPPPSPTITSFTASSATITLGGSASLTGVFSGGTGVVTPGALAATSGTAVSVSPTANTTYTLTVTNSAGVAVTQTATVTVNPAPTITSFVAAPATITAGGSSGLTAVFAGGTGVITPGNLAATSGMAVSVSPGTVSYTHLDVYKRQIWMRTGSRRGFFASRRRGW